MIFGALQPVAGFISGFLGQEPNESSLPQFREEVLTRCLLARADDEIPWLLLLALLAWGNHQHIIVFMSRCGNTDLGNSVSAFLSRGAVCILTSNGTNDKHHGSTSHAGEWKCSTEQEIHIFASSFLCSHICVDYYFSPGFYTLLFAPSQAGKDKPKFLTLECGIANY